jgi:hypothetical protein
LIFSAIARARSASQAPLTKVGGRGGLNKTSIKPALYGERFVKRRGLFSVLGHRITMSLFRLRKPAGQ